MAYAFMTTGTNVWVVPPGFVEDATQPLDVMEDSVVVADPAKGQLTNDSDREVIASLTGVASRSTAFLPWRIFVTHSTQSVPFCCLHVVCCCCMHCGQLPTSPLARGTVLQAREVCPGESVVRKLVPMRTTAATAPLNQSMERSADSERLASASLQIRYETGQKDHQSRYTRRYFRGGAVAPES